MASITLEDLRKSYPDNGLSKDGRRYGEWSDQELASAYTAATGITISDFSDDADQPELGGRPKWTENFVGDGKIDTLGEDAGAAIGSGFERGAVGVAGLPGAIMNSIGMGLEKAGLGEFPDEDRFFGFPEAKAAVNKLTASQEDGGFLPEALSGVGTDYKPTTRTGKYLQTGADFAVGAVLPGTGFNNLGRNVLAPALVSETAGQVTEGTTLEPYARMAGGIFGGKTLEMLENMVAGGKVSPAYQNAVDALRARGVTPTAGQSTDTPRLQAAEDSSGAGRALYDRADESYTNAAIQTAIPASLRRTIDVPQGTNATQAVVTIRNGLGRTMDSLAESNSFVVTPDIRLGFQRTAGEYADVVTAGGHSAIFQNLSNQMANATVVSGEAYQRMRTQLSKLTQSPEQATREAAAAAQNLIDNAMEASIRSGGNRTELARYQDARQGYRDLLILEKALTFAKSRGSRPVIGPAELANAAKSNDIMAYVQGRSSYNDLIRYGADVLKKPGNTGTSDRLGANAMALMPVLPGAGLAYGSGAGGAGMATAGVLSLMAPAARNRLLATGAAQNYFDMTSRRGLPVPTTSLPAATGGLRQDQY